MARSRNLPGRRVPLAASRISPRRDCAPELGRFRPTLLAALVAWGLIVVPLVLGAHH